MSKIYRRSICLILALIMTVAMLAGCGGGGNAPSSSGGKGLDVDAAEVAMPLAEKATIKGLTNFPVGTESDPNNRTIFKRLEEQTNVHVDWRTIQSDQWGEKIQLEMSNAKTMPDFVFNAGFGDVDLLKYAKNGAIIALEDYIDKYMPNLCKVFEEVPEYKAMCYDTDGHIWALPWIEQLGYRETAIQLLGNMPFINVAWLNFLGLSMPTTVDEFENVLIAFRDNADKLKAEFNIDGEIIPMSCIVNDGGQDPFILCNGFGEGYGDPDAWKHMAVTDEGKVVCVAQSEGYKKGLAWLNKLYEEKLIDVEAFTQDWNTYVAKGKSGRYGVCFSWDVANICNVVHDASQDVSNVDDWDWQPLPMLKADTKVITPATASFTSGFQRGRCVVTSVASNPALVCAWLDQMYVPIQSPQNNWGTYGEDDEFDIFAELGTNSAGEPMLYHADLGDKSPVEFRDAESVNGPLAVLNSYYGKYVTFPPDAQYRCDWVKDIYAPDCKAKYCLPSFFMTQEDSVQDSNLGADIGKCVNEFKARSILEGFTDADWDKFQSDLQAYKVDEYVALYQKYMDAYIAAQ
ncbi:MAG: extracellular solute-binding protein [Oscillospiraceae bacterium]|nr:extracellular solute-binding protein [Oscillospiraceae bacterium]